MKKSLSFFMAIVMALSSLCGITVCGAEMICLYYFSFKQTVYFKSDGNLYKHSCGKQHRNKNYCCSVS